MAPTSWRLVFLLLLVISLMLTGVKSDFVSDLNAIAKEKCGPFVESALFCLVAVVGSSTSASFDAASCSDRLKMADCTTKFMCRDTSCPLSIATKFTAAVNKSFTTGKCSSEDISSLGCGDIATFRSSWLDCQSKTTAVDEKTKTCATKAKDTDGNSKDTCKLAADLADCALQNVCRKCDAKVVTVEKAAVQYVVETLYAAKCTGTKSSYTATCENDPLGRIWAWMKKWKWYLIGGVAVLVGLLLCLCFCCCCMMAGGGGGGGRRRSSSRRRRSSRGSRRRRSSGRSKVRVSTVVQT